MLFLNAFYGMICPPLILDICGETTFPDEDKTENNGMPDCGEPNIDEYEEILINYESI